MRRAHFVDTSILCCLLRVPKFCDDNYAAVGKEFERIARCDEVLLLPVASILETGNHIAHISEGGVRRTVALEFAGYLRDTADNQAPWSLVERGWAADDLRNYAAKLPDHAVGGIGLGDLSVIEAYSDYIARTPGISVRIWSLDHHLAGYSYDAPEIGRRNRR